MTLEAMPGLNRAIEIPQVALLHRKSIVHGFLSTLGDRFLTALYSAISQSPYSSVITVCDGNIVLGFVAVCVSTKKMNSWILRHKMLRLLWPILLLCFSARHVVQMLETLRYMGGKMEPQEYKPGAELLSVAVSDSARQKGIGRKLILAADKFFRKHGISEYCVVTDAADPVSNNFYSGCGFVQYRSFYHHGNLMNEYRKQVAVSG